MKEKHINADIAAEKSKPKMKVVLYIRVATEAQITKPNAGKVYPYPHIKGGMLIPPEEQ